MTADPTPAALDPALTYEIDVGSADFKKHWREHLTAWSTRPPFYAVDKDGVMVMVGRYADAVEVFSDRERFSVELPSGPGFERFDKFYGVRVLTQMDGADHDRLRRLTSPAYGPAAMRTTQAELGRVVDALLDVLPTDGSEFDIVELFTDHLMDRIMLDGMFGLQEHQRTAFNRMREVIPLATTLAPGASFPQVYVDAFAATQATIHELIEERRTRPGDDIISRLVHARAEDDRFTDTELHDAIFTLCATALQSTSSAMGGQVVALWRNPDQLAAVRADRTLVTSAVEEGLRLHGPGLFTFPRFARGDTTVGGTRISKGMIVRVSPAAANLDPTVYPDPLRYDARRNPQKILSFGWGSHICIAQRLARMALNTSLDRLLDRFPTLELADPDFEPEYHGQVGELVPARVPMRVAGS